jgi:hypothetical protein
MGNFLVDNFIVKNKLEELKPFKVAKPVLTHQTGKSTISTISTLVKIK